MRKSSIVFALLFVAQFSFANVITGQAAIPEGYYNDVNGKGSAASILDALCGIIDGHTVIPYKGLEPYYEKTDFYADTLWDMYSTCRFTMAEANKPQSAVCDGWNKEHVVCQSWLGSGPMDSDLFNVYPTDARVNNLRSNFPYGEVSGANGTGITKDNDHHALGKKGSNTFSGYSGTAFEPHDNYKGDFARTFMYMVARYRNNILNSSTEGKVMYVSGKTDFTTYAKNLLMKWHRADPVSQKEIDRNQAVYGIQKNRNPFIDYPELAEYIWGNKVGQQVNLSTMTPTCEGGSVTPVETVKYGVTWSANGEIIRVDSIAENGHVTSMPATPVSCSTESNVFVGWTNAPIAGTTDEAPAALYTSIEETPAITADITLYAVFAHEESTGSSAPAVYTFDKDNQEGWTCSGTWTNNSYWLLETGTSIVSPKVDLMGLASITVKMRTYGGKDYKNLDITTEFGSLTTMVAESGSTMTEYTWNNNLYIAGTSALTFTSTYGSNKGVGVQSIIINATGASVTRSRYITSCQSTQELELLPLEGTARKIMVNGQLLIIIDNQLFTITGQKIK